jgi:glycosyltransferase involved in cell wall biosynthesis
MDFGRHASLIHSAAMISVIVPTGNSAHLLPRCFECLIAGVVSGLVREVIVADGGSSDETLTIADSAGARVVVVEPSQGSRMAAGAAAARGEWLLFLHPETALEGGWEKEAEAFLERVTLERPRAATFRFALDDFGARVRRAELLAWARCALFGLPYGDQGLLVSRRFYIKLGGHRVTALEDVDLIRRIGRTRLVVLRARAINKAVNKNAYRRRAFVALLHALRIPRGLVAFIGG